MNKCLSPSSVIILMQSCDITPKRRGCFTTVRTIGMFVETEQVRSPERDLVRVRRINSDKSGTSPAAHVCSVFSVFANKYEFFDYFEMVWGSNSTVPLKLRRLLCGTLFFACKAFLQFSSPHTSQTCRALAQAKNHPNLCHTWPAATSTEIPSAL